MLVYIIFLYICSFIYESDYIYKISLAATFSSVFFTFSDVFFSLKRNLKTYLNKISKFNDCLGKDIKSYILKSEQDTFYENMKREISKLEKLLKPTNILGNISFALGVFVFLMILAFYNEEYVIFQYLIKYQNQITIQAFAIVLLNYFFDDVIYKKINNRLDSVINKFNSLNDNLNSIISILEEKIMDKLKMQTVNKVDENFKKLAEMFPNSVTETINEKMKLGRATDKDVLIREIS